MSEKEIEAAIQAKGLNAPRLSPDKIDAVIVGETYTMLPSGKVMVCELTLANGYTVRGEAATVSKENFDEEIGRRISRENARNAIWPLEGYLLQQRIHDGVAQKTAQAVTDEMVNRFLSWPLPEDVCVDPNCAKPGDGNLRVGTSLLTHAQARLMLEHVLAVTPSQSPKQVQPLDTAGADFTTYQSHKIVHAMQIEGIQPSEDGSGACLIGADKDDQPCEVFAPRDWLAHFKPEEDGYLVIYADGYTSYSPQEAFVKGYIPLNR